MVVRLKNSAIKGKALDLLLRRRHFFWSLIVLSSVGLLASSVYRAANFPFTHDESLSFSIFAWNSSVWPLTANNHLLNTWLMKGCSALFGNSELSLRLPNILAHALYLTCSLLILRRMRSITLLFAGFILLNLNLFLLDFFFLARGYGLALSCMMLSLYLLVRAYEARREKGFGLYLFFSVCAGYLAVIANFSFLNFLCPLLLVVTWLIFSDSGHSKPDLKLIVALFLLSGTAFSLILPRIFAIKRAGQLFFGGKVGFITDTMSSLVRCSLYRGSHSSLEIKFILIILISFLAIVCLIGLWKVALERTLNLFVLFLFILILSLASAVIEHYFLNVLFPVKRAALYYIPLLGLTLVSSADSYFNPFPGLNRLRTFWTISLFVATLLPAIHFARNFNFHDCFSWRYDRHDKEVMKMIYQDAQLNFPGRIIVIGNDWHFEPSLNYYRFIWNFRWMTPATRAPLNAYPFHYIYAFKNRLDGISVGNYRRLASFQDIGTVLLGVKQDHYAVPEP